MGPRLGGLLTKDLGKMRRIFMSPGPIFDPEDRKPDYWGWTEGFYAAGFRTGDIVQNCFNYHLNPAGLMFEEPLRNLECAVIPAGPGNTNTQLEIMKKLKVTGYVGTASYLSHIAQKGEDMGINLRKDLSLEVAFVTAEKLSEKVRSTLEKKIRPYNETGIWNCRCGVYWIRMLPQKWTSYFIKGLCGNMSP